LTRELIQKIDVLIDNGIYPNRSEAVRDAVRRLEMMG
jgi:Arc/MetJ-type ribon-helix-helix transcriptional regulator